MLQAPDVHNAALFSSNDLIAVINDVKQLLLIVSYEASMAILVRHRNGPLSSSHCAYLALHGCGI